MTSYAVGFNSPLEIIPPIPVASGNTGTSVGDFWLFGNGADGSLHFDGTATFSFATKTGNVYVLNRSIYATDCLIDAGVTVCGFDQAVTNVGGGNQVFCSGTLTVNGSLNNDGAAPGANPATGGLGGSNQGGVTTLYGAGANAGSCPGAGSAGGAGTSIISSFGGAAGAGGASASPGSHAGGAGGTVTIPDAKEGGGVNALWIPWILMFGRLPLNSSPLWRQFFPGAGAGAGGGQTSVATGGGGGGGGGILGVFARIIAAGSGIISTKGGDGARGDWQAPGGGGGGGGGGGILGIITTTSNFASLVTCSVAGGIGGGVTGGAVAGTNGSPGTLVSIIVKVLV